MPSTTVAALIRIPFIAVFLCLALARETDVGESRFRDNTTRCVTLCNEPMAPCLSLFCRKNTPKAGVKPVSTLTFEV